MTIGKRLTRTMRSIASVVITLAIVRWTDQGIAQSVMLILVKRMK